MQENRERLTHSHTPLHLHAQEKSELTASPRSAQLKIRRKQFSSKKTTTTLSLLHFSTTKSKSNHECTKHTHIHTQTRLQFHSQRNAAANDAYIKRKRKCRLACVAVGRGSSSDSGIKQRILIRFFVVFLLLFKISFIS